MRRILLFNKPFHVLCQFTDRGGGDKKTLADYLSFPGIYAAGRLDYDSEGLLVLTDDGRLQHWISDPKSGNDKTYLVQVEGIPEEESLRHLRGGVVLNDVRTFPAEVQAIAPPALWERFPPIRYRKNVPTSWLRLTIREGRNRQVRRMTAQVGLPTLRLVRVGVGPWDLGRLQPGEWRRIE